jgi:DUF1680 family protein
VQVSGAYPAGDTVTVNIVEAPAAEITPRLRVPAWAFGAAKVSGSLPSVDGGGGRTALVEPR